MRKIERIHRYLCDKLDIEYDPLTQTVFGLIDRLEVYESKTSRNREIQPPLMPQCIEYNIRKTNPPELYVKVTCFDAESVHIRINNITWEIEPNTFQKVDVDNSIWKQKKITMYATAIANDMVSENMNMSFDLPSSAERKTWPKVEDGV